MENVHETRYGGNKNVNDLPSAIAFEWVAWKYEKMNLKKYPTDFHHFGVKLKGIEMRI